MRTQKLAKRVISILLMVLCAVIIVYFGAITANKWINTSYGGFASTDKRMIEALSASLSSGGDDAEALVFNKPVLFVAEGGFMRGNAYLFNFSITEHRAALGMNAGVFATEIVLSEVPNLPSVYRLSLVSPGLGGLLFSQKQATVNLYGTDIPVVVYSDTALANGAFSQSVKLLCQPEA